MINAELLKERIYLYWGIFVFLFSHLFASVYNLNGIFSVVSLCLVILLLLSAKGNSVTKSFFKFSLFILFVLLLVLSVQQNTGIGAIVIFMLFLFQYVFLSKLKLDKVDYKYITIFFVFFTILYSIVNRLDFNSNTVGFVFLTCGIYLTLFIKHDLKGLLWLFIISAFILPNIYLSESRTSLLAYVFYLLLRFMSFRIYKSPFLFKTLIFLLTIGSLLYAYMYVYVFLTEALDISSIEEVSSSEKHLYSGRQFIWLEVLEHLSETPSTGIGSKIHLQSFEESVNFHNSMLNFFAIYGVIVGILVVAFIFKFLKPLQKVIDNYIVRNCLSGYFTFLLVGFSETNLLRELFISSLVVGIAYSIKNNIKESDYEVGSADIMHASN